MPRCASRCEPTARKIAPHYAVLLAATLLSASAALQPCRGDVSGSVTVGEDAAGAGGTSTDVPSLPELLEEFEDESLAVCGVEELLREAAAFRENPVDVNSASLVALMRVPFLDPGSAARIVAARRRLGPVHGLQDLVARGCLDPELLALVRPYVVARPPPATAASGGLPAEADRRTEVGTGAAAVSWDLRSRVVMQERWERSWGPRSLAGGLGTFLRFRATYRNRLRLSVACEKDVGEADLADHAVGSVVWDGRARDATEGPSIQVGLGDFSTRWGQGLLARTGGFPSAASYPLKRDAVGAYGGAGEVCSRRGLFVTASRGRLTALGLWARTGLDAATDDEGRVTSIRTSGHHRTAGEIEGQSALTESMSGLRLTAAPGKGVELSGSVLRFEFSPELAPGDPRRQRFRAGGEVLVVGGLDARTELPGGRMGCELAGSSAGGLAALVAARASPGRARLSAGAAYFSKEFWSPLGGGAPGVSGGTNGAVAWLGAEYAPDAGWKLWVRNRLASRPWRSYHSELPDGSTSLTMGGEVRAKSGWDLTLESRVVRRSASDGDPTLTSASTTRRVSARLRSRGRSPVSLGVRHATSNRDRIEEGRLLAVSLRVDSDMGDFGTCTVGLVAGTTEGTPPAVVQHVPRLPGEFGLRSLNAAGARWYIRVRAALPTGHGVSARVSGGPERDTIEFGLGLDARG